MANINIVGNSVGGRFNIVEYNFTSSTPISSFNNSLCAVQTVSNTQQSIQVYRPTDLFPPFTQFVPNSGYIVFAKSNFSLSGTELPVKDSINIVGNSAGGRFNIVEYNFTTSTPISSFNSSLCAVQTTSNTQQSIQVYRPTDLFPPFTQFVPNSGYIVFAKESFTVSDSLSGAILSISGDVLLTISGDTLVFL